MATPYDGKVCLWHWEGDAVSEPDIQTLARNVKNSVPVADAIFVKTSDGGSWQGRYDSKDAMSVESQSDVSRWVNTLANFGLEFHGWAVVRGVDLNDEISRVVEAGSVSGVRSMILDVEPYQYYWQGSRDDVIRLMEGIRNRLGPDYHIGLSIDPRRQWYDDIFPDAWHPYVDSVHPQCYYGTMRRTPEDVIGEAYTVWGKYNRPIYPVLQAHSVSPDSIRKGQDYARSVRGAPGMSYWRIGVIEPSNYEAINHEKVESEVGPDQVWRRYGWEKVVVPGGKGYLDGTHTGRTPDQEFTRQFIGVRGHVNKVKRSGEERDKVWALWRPGLPRAGTYEISVYIPSQGANTRRARYHIHGIQGRGTELRVRLDQSRYSNQWVPLVVYDFQKQPDGGQVNLTNFTGESGFEVGFSAVRWREVLEQVRPNDRLGFDPPVGTAEERVGDQIWPGTWFDATGYATYYTALGPAYHTGADLNNNTPRWDTDRGQPVFSPASGVVTFSAPVSGSWGYIMVIRHDPLADGTVVWSRLGHIDSALVGEGDRVERGQQVASVGNAGGRVPYHLHFDIAKTNVLEQRPGHWPGLDLDEIFRNYHDPKKFIQDHRPLRS